MTQAFTTIYTKDYKWKEQPKRHPYSPHDKFSETLPEGDIWLVKKQLEEEFGKDGLSAAEDLVKKMYLKRYMTTYRTDYCRDMLREEGLMFEDDDDSGGQGHELVYQSSKLYKTEKDEKILPPLSTSRRLFGYMKPGRMYTPLTSYQHDIGQLAYDILRGVQPKKREPFKIPEETEEALKKDAEEIKADENRSKRKRSRSANMLATSSGLKVYKYWDDSQQKMTCTCICP